MPLRSLGFEPILLRGPAFALGFYEDPASRTYTDVDLLVPLAELAPARAVLSRLGFVDRTVSGVIAGDRPTYALTWVRPADSANVDLHYSLRGIGASAQPVWDVLTEPGQTETLTVGSLEATVLNLPGRALVAALHAAAHGAMVEKPIRDLSKALECLSAADWRAATALARRLEAIDAFAVGLRLLPAGRELADRLDLPSRTSVESALRASTAPPMALGFDWLARTQGTGAKARLIARKLAPRPDFMRAWSPLARRGPAGLVGAYGLRLIWLARHAVPALVAWWGARERVR